MQNLKVECKDQDPSNPSNPNGKLQLTKPFNIASQGDN